MTLPIIFKPKEDELLDSYLNRLVKANCLSYKEFLKVYNLKSQYDIFNFLIQNGIFNSFSEIVLNHTIYPIKAVFTNPYRQALLLNHTYSGINTSSTKDSLKTFICPKCEYTKVYESLKGISECPDHSEIANPDLTKLCKTIFTIKPDIDSFDLKMNRKNISVEEGLKKLLNEGLPSKGEYDEEIAPNVYIPATIYKPIEEIIFDKYNPIKIDNEYEVIYNSKSLIELVHKKCGTRFLTNAFGYDMFYRCPKCCDTLENLYKRQVEKSGQYKLIKYGSASVILKHLKCGNNIHMKTRAFLEGTRCRCENMWTETKLDSYFKTYHPDFIPVTYKNETVTLTHSACNNQFSKNLIKWFKNPKCPICNPKFELNNKSVENKIEELGFKLVSPFVNHSTKIDVKCSKGHKWKIEYYTLLDNPVCPLCNKESKDTIKNKIISYIKDNYSDDDIVFVSDLPEAISSTFKTVFEELGMSKIANGAYSRYEYDPEEIVELRYLGKNNDLGYTYGESFAYELGLTYKPDILSIASVREKAPDGRLVKYANSKVRLKSVPSNFNIDILKEIQMSDFISGINRYIKNPFGSAVVKALQNNVNTNNLDLKIIENNLTKNNRWTRFIMSKLYETKK